MRQGWSEIEPGVSTPNEAFTRGPDVQWDHIDGPLLHWAGHIHWLTWAERLGIALRLTSVEKIACHRWPYKAHLRRELTANPPPPSSRETEG